MHDPSRVFTVIQEDLPAANGVIHIIDQPITNVPPARSPRDEQVSPGSLKSPQHNPFLMESFSALL